MKLDTNTPLPAGKASAMLKFRLEQCSAQTIPDHHARCGGFGAFAVLLITGHIDSQD